VIVYCPAVHVEGVHVTVKLNPMSVALHVFSEIDPGPGIRVSPTENELGYDQEIHAQAGSVGLTLFGLTVQLG
jgi:hypothetical protein